MIERALIPPGAVGAFHWNAPLPHGNCRDSIVHVGYRRDRDSHSGQLDGPTERQDGGNIKYLKTAEGERQRGVACSAIGPTPRRF